MTTQARPGDGGAGSGGGAVSATFESLQNFRVELFEGRWWILELAAKDQQSAIANAEDLVADGVWENLEGETICGGHMGWYESSSEEAIPLDFGPAIPAGLRYEDHFDGTSGWRWKP